MFNMTKLPKLKRTRKTRRQRRNKKRVRETGIGGADHTGVAHEAVAADAGAAANPIVEHGKQHGSRRHARAS
jgi:hypothetical protein